MAGVGVLILLWTVIKLLGNIEISFNDIFGGVKCRSFGRKIIDYCAIIILLPFLLILSTTLTVFLESQANFIVEKLPFLAGLSPSMHFLIELVPYVLIWLGFIFLYLFVPNCKVKIVPGIIAGITAGTAFNVVLWFYFAFQVGMAKNSAIYGAFAAVPLFIAWLQVSWTIVLCGAELAFGERVVGSEFLLFEHHFAVGREFFAVRVLALETGGVGAGAALDGGAVRHVPDAVADAAADFVFGLTLFHPMCPFSKRVKITARQASSSSKPGAGRTKRVL